MSGRLTSFAAALGGAGGAFMSELRKGSGQSVAELEAKRAQSRRPRPKALFSDILGTVSTGPYKEPVGGMSFDAIRQAVELMPVLAVIIMIRVNQVASFARPARNQYDVGFKISLRDEKAKPSKASRKEVRRLTRFTERCGVNEGAGLRDGFHGFMSKVTEDAMTFSQWAAEIVEDRRGQPAAFYAVDATTMRFAADHVDNDLDDTQQDIRYVQVVDGMPVAGFTYDEMILGIMNPTTDIRQHGYGISFIERVSKAVAQLIYAFDHNSRVFEQGANVRGLINFPGMPDKTLQKMRQTFDMWLRGPSAAHTMPLVNCSEPVQVTNLSLNNREMEYSSWADYLIKIACGAALMAPEELNLSYGGIGQTNSLGNQPNNREKIFESRERGLTPLLTLFGSAYNKRILQRLNPDFVLSFTGLNAMTRSEREDYNSRRVRSTHTVNEVRAEEDLPPLKQGDIILDPVIAQMAMAANNSGQADGAQGGTPASAQTADVSPFLDRPQPHLDADAVPDTSFDQSSPELKQDDDAAKSIRAPRRRSTRPVSARSMGRWLLEM